MNSSIRQTTAFVKCSRVYVVKVFKDSAIRQKTGSQYASQVKDSRTSTLQQMAVKLNQVSSRWVSELAVRDTMSRMGYKRRWRFEHRC